MEQKSKIVSLNQKRTDSQRSVRKKYLPHEDRTTELETEMIRLLDIVIELEGRMQHQEKFLQKLMHLLRTQN